ncbi:MAG TPA: 7-dehydrocholesterol reductase [Coxiellaceae bacterium]|nr:MAG: 7-dehydrocholesterol reductase [Gammaproteobacteria bacterium RIFCSPHIGHO2_12_FULL_36_30]HLB56747.1 7-dehydrocholesterol reductase [Coxiellaceae bacterium]
MKKFFQKTIGPLFLMITCPPAVILAWYINTNMQGSLLNFAHIALQNGIMNTIWQIWQPVFFGTHIAWKIILIFMAIQLLLMRIVPGKTVTGPETANGNIPVYKDNGFLCFIITLALFYLGTEIFHIFSATIVYDNFAGILGSLNIFSLIFCLILYYKGRFKPSTSDHSTTGNFIFDYYWGTELYPTILGWNVKQFTNCRFGMMSWAVIIISFAAKQAQLYGLQNSMIACVAIMLFYIAKFFWWESGYFRSMDIMHDRAGFYICWGCLVWVPGIYTLPAMYLVNHPISFSPIIAALIIILGVTCVILNYFADAQRQKVRATQGNCIVWGKAPQLIHAKYIDQHGDQKQSLLLTSGWWGISRHFHYLLEIGLAFFWTLPVLFINFLPWFYVVFLTILLVHRSYRDDQRCAKKYGEYWKEYCMQVPNKIIPWRKLLS